ncbi:chemotaxis protein [Aeromonas veronii]|uniref:methyl-accepting chemotaxis protein n=1 Tax=Aeromonas veronii TaxID=654 RepID=UPI001117ADB7|nr:methyl-accepting chemotaxis protein [Aeromonas veronii]TNJ11823.1 chemotaxis protein [Aeromonas veronii]
MDWLRTISIKLRLSLLLAALLATMFGMGLSQKQSADTINDMLNNMYLNQLVPITDVANANMQAIYHHRELFNYVIEPKQSEMDRIAGVMDKYETQMMALLNKYRATELTPDETRMLADFDRQWPSYKAVAKKAMDASYRNDNDVAMQLMKSEVASTFQQADDTLSAIVNKNVELGKTAYDDSDVVVAQLGQEFVITMGLVLVIAAIAGVLIIRSILAPLDQTVTELSHIAKGNLVDTAPPSGNDELTNLQHSMASTRKSLKETINTVLHISEELGSSAAQLSSAAQQVMTSSEMQAQATASSAASIEEMSTSIAQLSHSANSANEQAMNSGNLAQQGEHQVEGVSREVRAVTDAINQSTAQIRQLADDVTKVGQITVMIKGVADQTNLLALNAAIEAARAGDMGRGFAVVADEVRQLAERTTKATQEIDSMISGVQSTAMETVNTMDRYVQSIENVRLNTAQASDLMAKVDQSSQAVVGLMGEINVMLHEQSSASQLIAQSVEEVNNMSQENVSASECVNGEAVHLTQVVGELKKSVSIFKLS